MRALCAGSALLDFVQETCVQDAYALRCVPQVHGAIRGALDHVLSVLSVEFNAVTDNPLVFADDDAVISGGAISTASPWRWRWITWASPALKLPTSRSGGWNGWSITA